jgi:hypothetical protein
MNERDETLGRESQDRYGTYRWGQRPPRGERPRWRHEGPAWNERTRWREPFPRDQFGPRDQQFGPRDPYGRERSSEQLFERQREPFGPGEDTHYYGTGAPGRGGPGFTGGAYGWGNGPRDQMPSIEDEFSDESAVSYEHGGYRGARAGGQRMYPRGPKGYQRSDERIREDICERLMGAYYIDSSEVTVSVKNGKVLLEGSVPDRNMKHSIENIVDSCLGVVDIENHVRVGTAATPPAASPAGGVPTPAKTR